jgi:hypothetical protein
MGMRLNGTIAGVEVLDCEVCSNRNTTELGIHQTGFKGILAGTSNVWGNGGFTISDSSLHSAVRLIELNSVLGNTGFATVQRSEWYDYSADAIMFGGLGSSGTTIQDNLIYNLLVDKTFVALITSDPIKTRCVHTGALSGVSNGKQMVMSCRSMMWDRDVTQLAHRTIWDQGGDVILKWKTDGKLELTAKDTSGVVRVTLTSANDLIGATSRSQILIKLDNDATNYMYVWQQGTDGSGAWVQEASQAGTGHTLRFATGNVCFGSLIDGTELMCIEDDDGQWAYTNGIQVWYGAAAGAIDITSSSVRANFADSIGMPGDIATLRTTYGAPQVDLYGTDAEWTAGTMNNDVEGNTFASTGTFDIDHPDYIQSIVAVSTDLTVQCVSTTPAVFEAKISGVTTAHGRENGDPVRFVASALGFTGGNNTSIYYVVNKTNTQFSIASTVGGVALNASSTGTTTIGQACSNVTIARNVMISERDDDLPTLNYSQGIFIDDIRQYGNYVRFQIHDNLIATLSTTHGFSIHNGHACNIYNNTLVYNPDWVATVENPTTYPTIRMRVEGTNGMGQSNVIANNFAAGGVSYASTITGTDTNNITSNHLTAIPGTQWTDYFDSLGSGDFTCRTTAEFLTAFKAKVGGGLLTVSPNVGAVGTGYSDFEGNTSQMPLAERT